MKEMKQPTKLYICVTPYHLYLSLLLINNEKNSSRILLNANNEELYKQFLKIAPKLHNNGYTVYIRLRNKLKDIIGVESMISKKQFKAVFTDKNKRNFELYNFAWNCQYVYSTADIFYKKCKEAYFVEEGALTPINPPQPGWKVALKKITGSSVNFYKDAKLKGIYVQKPEMYPAIWKHKLIRLDVKKILSETNKEVKQTILDVFIGELAKKLKEGKNGIGIIYTQPLSEDGFISEEMKKDYFLQMVDYYGRGQPVFLKIHPRDLSNYQVPDNCTVLPGFFPSELLNLLDLRFRFAVGICTSAVATTAAEIQLNVNENFLIDKKFKLVPLEERRAETY